MSSTKILIVDDELIMRESLAGWLERDGHFVQTSPSGEDALEKLKETRFDILLVDIKMEGISGLDVLKAVRETDNDTAVVMISRQTQCTGKPADFRVRVTCLSTERHTANVATRGIPRRCC